MSQGKNCMSTVVCSWPDWFARRQQVSAALSQAPMNGLQVTNSADLSVRQPSPEFASQGRLKSRIHPQPSEGTHERYRSTR